MSHTVSKNPRWVPSEGSVLVIRKEQFQLLTDSVEVKFAAELAAFLRERMDSPSSSELSELTRHVIARAGFWDIRAESDVCKYAILSLVLGADFDQRLPWAAEILKQVPHRG